MAVQLDSQLQFVKGVGPRLAESLKAKGFSSVEDLLYHLPFRYEDRANPMPLSSLQAGQMASVIGEVRGSVLLRTSRMPIFELTVGQNLATLKCMWFHGAYLKDKYQAGQMVAVYGKAEPSRSTRGFKMINPQVEILSSASVSNGTTLEEPEATLASASLEMGRIVPVYESLGGVKLNTRWLRRVVWNLLAELEGAIPETLPQALCARLTLPSEKMLCEESISQPSVRPLPSSNRLLPRRSSGSSLKNSFTSNSDSSSNAAARASRPASPSPLGTTCVRHCEAFCPFILRRRKSGLWVRSSLTCAGLSRCGACYRAMSARARRSSPSRPCSWRLKTATKLHSWRQPRS